MTFRKTLSGLVAVSLVAIAAPALAQDAAAGQIADPAIETSLVDAQPMIVAKVNGLVCDFCAQALKKVFKKEEGVKDLTVDLDAGEVRIALKEGGEISDETVAKLIRKSGYSLVSTERIGGA